MAKNTCTSCGGSGVVKNKEKEQQPSPSPKSRNKEKNSINASYTNKPKDYKFTSNAQRKNPPKEKK